jgi:hypothetical protein
MHGEQNPPPFIPGLELAQGFFHDEVQPILESHYPGLPYSAALIGSGSEVLGFDTEMSADHHWGPRTMLFLCPDDFASKRDDIRATISNGLPTTYRGHSTNFSEPDPEDNGVQLLQPVASGPVNHRVEMYTLHGFFLDYVNVDIAETLEAADWLTLPQQKLRSITSGRVFHDDLGLEEIRARFSWYPHDVWLYVLASAWARIGQEGHLMGRAGLAGDEIGSAIIGSRLVRDIMRLAFLMEKEYAPYAKWFGTGFTRLRSAGRLAPFLTDALPTVTWEQREASLCPAYEILAQMHNDLGITERLPTQVSQFWGRPFRVIQGDRFTKAIMHRIRDRQIVALTRRRPIGSIDLWSDSTDLLEDGSLRSSLAALYR